MFRETALPGVFLIEPERREDRRVRPDSPTFRRYVGAELSDYPSVETVPA